MSPLFLALVLSIFKFFWKHLLHIFTILGHAVRVMRKITVLGHCPQCGKTQARETHEQCKEIDNGGESFKE